MILKLHDPFFFPPLPMPLADDAVAAATDSSKKVHSVTAIETSRVTFFCLFSIVLWPGTARKAEPTGSWPVVLLEWSVTRLLMKNTVSYTLYRTESEHPYMNAETSSILPTQASFSCEPGCVRL
jgi:hypothetical protein